MKAVLTICCLFFFSILSAQEADSTAIEEPKETEIFTVVEEMPEFPGGEAAMMEYISQNTHYPSNADPLRTKVNLQFVVDENGKISDIKVIGSCDSALATEAIRLVNNMPNWTPGKQRGKAVKVRYVLPIRFEFN